MTELTALLTKALLSTTFGVSREQRYSADELRDALARASGSVAETRKVLSAQPEVDDISVESVANHLRDRLSKYIDVGSESVGHSFPVLGHNIRVPLPQHVTTYQPGDPTGSQSPQPHLEDGTTYRPLRPTKLDKIKNLHLEVQAGGVVRPLSRPVRRRRAASREPRARARRSRLLLFLQVRDAALGWD